MLKKIIVYISIISILVIGILIYKNIKKDKQEKNNSMIEDKIELNKFVTDDCIDEWEDYALTKQEELSKVNSNLTDENKTYILKAEKDYINIYYLNEKGEEVLYRVTEIPIQFLSKEDVAKLTEGIEVKGLLNVNQLLEDFE